MDKKSSATAARMRRLRVCDRALLAATALMLVSGIQLEILSGASQTWIWIHVIVGILFSVLIAWHLQLHFRWSHWLRRILKLPSRPTRWLTIFGLLTLLTGIAATAGWIASPDHSPLGAIHGKLGFIFIILAIGHAAKRARFYRRTPSRGA